MRIMCLLTAAVAAFFMGLEPVAAETLRIGAQMSGTFGWELALIKARGLDKAAGLDLVVTDLANTDAGKLAIASGSVDIVLSDWLWVSRERSLGKTLTFTPYSSALGAVMAKGDGPIKGLADLKGHKLGVAGGPLDKSWLLLQAYAKSKGMVLSSEAEVVYGAPPLLGQKTVQGEIDATLQFWNFCADLEQRGFKRVIEIADVEMALGAKGPSAMVGYVFDEKFAAGHAEALTKFLDIARQAKLALASEPGLWPDIMIRIGQKDPAAAAIFQKRYADGVPRRTIAEEEADARVLFHTLASVGGAELVGSSPELDLGAYYKPKSGS